MGELVKKTFAALLVLAVAFPAGATSAGRTGCVAWRYANECRYVASDRGAFAAAWQGMWQVLVLRDGVTVANYAGEDYGFGYLETQPGDVVVVRAKLPPGCPDKPVPREPACQEPGAAIAADVFLR